MCGIAGILSSAPIARETLAQASSSMVHRGPDDHGESLRAAVGGHLGMVSTRLAIIDLSSRGHQPMLDRQSGNEIVFNGEIYNKDDLAAELRRHGIDFDGTTDTEVILKGYRLWGTAIFAKLRGMFSLAIFDAQRDSLLLARDPLGIKPLYWSNDAAAFCFASEIRTLLPLRALEEVPQSSSPASPALRSLDAFTRDYMRAMNAPGMTLAIAGRNGILPTTTYGFSELESHTPLRPEQLFQIGSITKSFIATVLLQLRQEGKLDLQRPILDYLPWLPIESDFGVITPHSLLTHSSGLPDPIGLRPPSPDYVYAQRFKPGEHFHYCNLGFAILGELIRKLDNRPWTSAVRARIFEPLYMTSASPVYDTPTRHRSPNSYLPFASDRAESVLASLTPAGPETFEDAAGSICANAADMARYMSCLLNHGSPLLTPDSFALLTTPHIKAEDFSPTASYGYGIAVDTLDGHKILRHTAAPAPT
ncbi:MAG: hypothetical protein NVS9B15_18170 [Acidobacteriaceae bacterium]